MLRISWTEKKSNLEVLTAAGDVAITLMKVGLDRQRQPNVLGHVMRMRGLENLVLTIGT